MHGMIAHDLVYRGTSEIIPIIGDTRPQIVIGAEPLEDHHPSAKSYSGQRQILPGIIALVVALVLGFSGVTYFSIQEYQATLDQQQFRLAQASTVSGIVSLFGLFLACLALNIFAYLCISLGVFCTPVFDI